MYQFMASSFLRLQPRLDKPNGRPAFSEGKRQGPPKPAASGGAFHHVCNIERPLTGIRHFLDALLLISKNTEEPAGSAVNQICWTMVPQVEEVQAKYSTLFRLTHPRRERLSMKDGRWRQNNALDPNLCGACLLSVSMCWPC